jgi:hypothetical protein
MKVARVNDRPFQVMDSATGLGGTTPAFSNPMTTKGDLIVGATSGVADRLPAGTDGYVLTADSTQTDGVAWAAGGGGGSGSLLAVTRVATPSYTTTSMTNVDIDATNVKVVFTAPASTNVLIVVTSYGGITTNHHVYYQFREASSDIGDVQVVYQNQDGLQTTSQFYFSGISAGSHTYKLGWAVDGGTANIYNNQSIIISVYAAP